MKDKIDTSSVTFWEKRYDENQIGWHIEDVHPILQKYMNLLTEGKPGKRFFVPLCGKTKDIPYLLSLGHTVFGIEGVAQAVVELGEENGLKLEFSQEESTYSTPDKHLVVYCGDFFKCPIENWGPFDCIWDRGSFIALNYATREDYVAVMRRSVEKADGEYNSFKYLLQTVLYDKEAYAGPPKCVDTEDIERFFENWSSVKKLESDIVPDDSAMRKVGQNFPEDAYDETFLLQPKI